MSVKQSYTYLEARPDSWRRQLFIKGRNLTVGQLVATMRANRDSIASASREFDLPVAAIHEVLEYYVVHQDLIEGEFDFEAAEAQAQGIPFDPAQNPYLRQPSPSSVAE